MSSTTEFDSLNSPLQGANLIQASAGTGKTYTIAALFLRLIIELGIPLDEILVVTYTEAATSELKDRIRRKLREAIDVFSGMDTEDSFLQKLYEKHEGSPHAPARLEAAIRDFDEASIFTIHGFCLRSLSDHAFASGIQFDTELVTSEEVYVMECVQDFWRKHFYSESPLFYDYAGQTLHIRALYEMGRKTLSTPRLRMVPEQPVADCATYETKYLALFDLVRQEWEKSRGTVEALITSNPALDGRKYGKRYVPGWLRAMDDYLSGECLNCTPIEQLDRFCADRLAGATKGGQPPPSHRFFDLCERFQEARRELLAAYDQKIVALRREFLRCLRQDLQSKKIRKNILFFDDLLTRLHAALCGPNGKVLSGILKEKYKAALIDEFQDTDPIQYAIFEKVFGNPPSILFLIGDPKQAIYGFRGADIFTYIDASRKVSSSYTLSENWRSEPGLISAVNSVFLHSDNPFLFREIPFAGAKAAPKKDLQRLSIEGEPEPFRIWYVNSSEFSEKGGPVGKGEARSLIARSAAAEISQLIGKGEEGKASIAGRAVCGGDIAVLVRTNSEGQLVQQALTDLGIHSVLFNVGSIFESREAKELQTVLAAISHPSEEGLLKAALATDIMEVSGEDLVDDARWEEWILRFNEYHDIWIRNGFFRMLRLFLTRERVLPRLMSLADGERRCTNILHLAEVLHKAAMEGGLNAFGLLKWLSAQRDGDAGRKEEHQLRLESDEDAVKIVTIHKSKGLEYPIVFCPFSWGDSKLRDSGQPFTFHDLSLRDQPLTLDLGSSSSDLERHSGWAERELLAENLRLLYVALTRARHRCYLVWGRINGAGGSAPAYILHHSPQGECDQNIDSLKSRIEAMEDASLLDDLEELRSGASDTIFLGMLPSGEDIAQFSRHPARVVAALDASRFTGRIDNSWRISSFSSLTSDKPHVAEMVDWDELTVSETGVEAPEEHVTEPRKDDVTDLPMGAGTGILLHEIFQHLDFTSTDEPGARRLIAAGLKDHGFDPHLEHRIYAMIRKVLDCRLESGYGSFTLSQLKPSQVQSEMGFFFPLQRTAAGKLREILSRWVRCRMDGQDAPADFGSIRLETIEGFMRGFIDLVFEINGRYYILDWKSNFLGPNIEDYNRKAMEKVVRDKLYNLQYYLYTVALHQYLKVRIPDYAYETHFGEVFYLFLRGIDPLRGPHFGIYRDRPSFDSIEAICSNLILGKDR